MRVLIGFDSFKGSLSSQQANMAARRAVLRCMPDAEVVSVVMSDGGEGWLDACANVFPATRETLRVEGPMGQRVTASYLRCGEMAMMEVASVCGLTLLSASERNPMKASSRGLGQLLVHAIGCGCRRFVVGLGGSATCDAGRGMLRVMADTLMPGRELKDLSTLSDLHFTIACDVQNPLYGPLGAARVFAPQKGATPEMVEVLEEEARAFARSSYESMGVDCSMRSGAGAAGGLGYAFMQYLNAGHVGGADWILDAHDYERHLDGLSLVITGEGSADAQTLMGKLPFRVMKRAKAMHVPTLLLAGKVQERSRLMNGGFADVLCINREAQPSSAVLRSEIASSRLEACLFDYLFTHASLFA